MYSCYARMERIKTYDLNKTFGFRKNDTLLRVMEKKEVGKNICIVSNILWWKRRQVKILCKTLFGSFAICHAIASCASIFVMLYKDIKEFKHPRILKTVNETKRSILPRVLKRSHFSVAMKRVIRNTDTYMYINKYSIHIQFINLTVKQLLHSFHMKIIPNNIISVKFQQTTHR